MLQTQAAFTALPLASSLRSSNPLVDPPILRLPVELTLIIFGHCSSGVKARLSLSHTCQHWMSITTKTGALWTDIQIKVRYRAEGRLFENLISLLKMQFDRTAGLPLDVIWESIQTSAFNPRIMSLLRRKAPFSRWRTLQIRFQAIHPDGQTTFRLGDAFSNLESIVIYPSIKSSIITVLNRTTTSKLQVLDHRPTGSPSEVTLSDCSDMLKRIYCLKSSTSEIGGLSSNITQLDTSRQKSHSFSHLKTYNIQTCIFASRYSIDLRCLEILNISGLFIFAGTEVSLPALRHLTYGTITLRRTAKINTPLLESMHISVQRCNTLDARLADGTEEAIRNDGFLLSPSNLLIVDVDLSSDCIAKLLERSPRVERVSLSFDDEERASQVLERIGGAASEVDSDCVPLCGRLRELRLTFLWSKCDVESWKEQACQVVMNRIANGIALRIYGAWKGEGAYVVLA
jgi:F-box-like